ncbi:MAG: hypothetical protein ACOYI8_09075 [Christensenellales bacterium]
MAIYGYSTYFRPPKKKGHATLFWAILFCVILPPVGLFLVWGRLKCNLRGRLLLSLVAVLCMTVMLATALQMRYGVQEVGYTQIETPVTPVFVEGASPTAVPANPLK